LPDGPKLSALEINYSAFQIARRVPPSYFCIVELQRFAARHRAAITGAQSDCGHLAPGCEAAKITPAVAAFLFQNRGVRREKVGGRRMPLTLIYLNMSVVTLTYSKDEQ
jgi:hypothetical protein